MDCCRCVGIGTTSPNAKLEISGDTRSGGRILYGGTESNYLTGVSYASIYGTADTFESVSGLFGSLVLQSRSNTARPIIFVTGATPSEKMRLTSDGNLGIGTTSPLRELEIQGSGNVFARITASTDSDSAALELNNNGNELWILKAEMMNAADYFKITNNAGTALTIDTSKNVGIGTTSPDYELEVSTSSNSRIAATSVTNSVVNHLQADSSGAYVGPLSNHKLFIKTNNTTRVTVDTSGNVGIGTTSPGYKLDIYGSFGSNAGAGLRLRSCYG